MFDRLQSVEDRYDRLNEMLSDPDIVSDTNKLRDYSKEQSDLQETVETYREYKDVQTQLADSKAMFEEKMDADMREMVKEEVTELEGRS
ncbi:PCRF domain-containing protein, partial [Streptococcus pneumoniae]|nr:PCRF domain-containing protein [Streptococcus pneumoniae]